MRFIPSALLVGSCLLSAGVVEAVDDHPLEHARADVLARLDAATRAHDVRGAAWAAYLASRWRVAEADPGLRALLAEEPRPADQERQFLIRAVLDALIRIDAKPNDDELAHALACGFEAEVIALAAGDAVAHQNLLRGMLDRPLPDPHWLAVCNLLVAAKSPQVAAPLVRGVKLRLTLTVKDPGDPQGHGDFSGTARSGDGRMDVPEGFPPTAISTLVYGHRAGHGDILIAPGRTPIYLHRREAEGRVVGIGYGGVVLDRDEEVLAYLCELLEGTDPGLRAHEGRSLVWSDATDYAKDAADARADVSHRWQAMLGELRDRHLLPEADAALTVPLTVTVEDERSDTSVPLPGLEPPASGPDRQPQP